MMHDDGGIRNLLELSGQIIDQGNGYWIRIEAWEVPRSKNIPHGIRYSLSLHAPSGERLMGYDNAHAVKPPKKFKYAGTRLPHDHRHRHSKDKGVPYHFQSAYQLMEDFFKEVDQVLKELQK
jgi:hypothetical protein